MKPQVVSIRGTHGSGKSTIVKKILDKYPHVPKFYNPEDKRPYGYEVTLSPLKRLFVVGPYHTACGGCDAVQPYSDIWPMVHSANVAGMHVLFEGALVSSSYGSIGHAMHALQESGAADCTFAFLDTPLVTCLDRIAARRAAKGNLEPVNPHNTASKFDNVLRTKDQMRRLGSLVRIVDLDYEHPVTGVLKLFGVTLRNEP